MGRHAAEGRGLLPGEQRRSHGIRSARA